MSKLYSNRTQFLHPEYHVTQEVQQFIVIRPETCGGERSIRKTFDKDKNGGVFGRRIVDVMNTKQVRFSCPMALRSGAKPLAPEA